MGKLVKNLKQLYYLKISSTYFFKQANINFMKYFYAILNITKKIIHFILYIFLKKKYIFLNFFTGAGSIPSTSRPLSPGLNYGEGVSQRRESGHTPLFTPPPIMHGRVHSLTTPPGPSIVGVPSPSPPPPSVLPPSRPRHVHPPPAPPPGPHLPPTTKFS